MKLLETSLSGFESKADQVKDQGKQKYEAWSSIATPPYLIDESETGAFEAHPSGLDGVLILETPQEECTRRATGRKIDPTTQQIYHMESNPPEDNKILERLQDYEDAAGDPQRINRISTGFTQAIGAIKQWLTKFGLRDQDGKCVVPLDMDVVLEPEAPKSKPNSSMMSDGKEAPAEAEEPPAPKDPWTDREKVMDSVLKRVEKVMAYRQNEYNSLRDQVRSDLEE